MNRFPLLLIGFICNSLSGQSLPEKLERTIQKLESDPQLKHGIIGFALMDKRRGRMIYEHHAQWGLAPASCQKIFTSIAAFEGLGPGYRYQTTLSYEGSVEGDTLQGNLRLKGVGDPSLGSWRWEQTKQQALFQEILYSLQHSHIRRIRGKFYLDESAYPPEGVPDGWIWQDIGNYYGAGCWGINWHENQYDMILQSGLHPGDSTRILRLDPPVQVESMVNRILTGKKGSGDNGYIYLPPFSKTGFTRGTIPAGEPSFTISGSMPHPAFELSLALDDFLKENNIVVEGGFEICSESPAMQNRIQNGGKMIMTHFSPRLDSLNHWFLKKSINLFGEALVKSLSYEKTGYGSTEDGVQCVKDFWSREGIEPSALNILDGSGLSPQNRVSSEALVRALYFASSRSWYSSFYAALPEINHMRMKSGSIGGVRSYAGYQLARSGKEYIFAVLVNNYDGPANDLIQKIWNLLDLLK
jgi:serine-type D-Ala-D-Ala carboxypeptidase/endopeptidase (penicillin-binding protein 4)